MLLGEDLSFDPIYGIPDATPDEYYADDGGEAGSEIGESVMETSSCHFY